MHLPIDTLLNNNCYQIKRVIGQGGFGITYLAYEIGYYRNTGFGDSQYSRIKDPEQVVIKELFYNEYCQRDIKTGDVIMSNPEKAEEYIKLVNNQINEGIKLRQLNHPNIVRTRDIFKENHTAYMVMDYIESIDLEVLLKEKKKLEKYEAIEYISQILSATKHIHERNQLHLDIKPSNILIRKNTNEAVLIDFGASQSYSNTGEIEGRTSQLITAITKNYAPNEQADIDNLKHFDATFDTYAIGATLYHLLTGQKPPLSSLLSTGREKLTPPSFFDSKNINDYIDAILSKALAPLFHERYKSAAEFEEALIKESEYLDIIHQINLYIENNELNNAEILLQKAESTLLLTQTLKEFRKIINIKENKFKLDANFEHYYNLGLELFNKNEFKLALIQFEKALEINVNNQELQGKIAVCKIQIDKTNKKNKIDLLIKEANQNLSDKLFSLSLQAINEIISLSPENHEAKDLLQRIRETKLKESIKTKSEAYFAFKKHEYKNAKQLFESIEDNFLETNDREIINLLSPINISNYETMYAFVDSWHKKPFSKKNTEKFTSLELEKIYENLTLPCNELKAKYLEIRYEITEKNERTILINRKKKEIQDDKDDKTVVVGKLKQNRILKSKISFDFITPYSKKIALGVFLLITLMIILFFSIGKNSKKSIRNNVVVVNSDTTKFDSVKQITNNSIEAFNKTPKTEESKTDQIEDNSKKKSKKEINDSAKTIVNNTDDRKKNISTITFKGKVYKGSVKNEIPNGNGTLFYTKEERISFNDEKNTMSEPGDYLVGKWRNGELEYGTLYNSSNEKKIMIVIGRY